MVSSIYVSVITMTAHLHWCLFTTTFNIIIIYLYLQLQPVSWTAAWMMHPWLHPLPYCWKRTENRFQRGRLLQPRMKQLQRHLEVLSLEETWGSHWRASTLTVIPSPCDEIQSLCCLVNVCTCVYVLNWQLLLRAFQGHSEIKNSNKPNRLGISTGRRQTINLGYSLKSSRVESETLSNKSSLWSESRMNSGISYFKSDTQTTYSQCQMPVVRAYCKPHLKCCVWRETIFTVNLHAP